MSSSTPSSSSIFPTKVIHLPLSRQCGNFRRNGIKRLTFQSQDCNNPFLHAYRGEFLRDNYHGDGQYCELNPKKGNTLIDGKFYCNDVEGYASETTSDGNYFEGLFKENFRFGPGVLTYKDKTQDVGLWRGPNLVRLSVVVQSHVVPKLGVTPQGKSTLIQYRQLVELPECNHEARIYTILKNNGASDSLLQKYQLLCNKTCRSKDSLLFDTKLYDNKYFGQKDNFINVVMNEDEILEKERIKLEQMEEEERLKNSADVVGLETVEEILDTVMEEFGESTRNIEFARDILYEAIGNMDDSLERAKDERELIAIRNSYQRNLKQKYLENFDKTTLKKVPITHLITWNNEELAVNLLKHCFLHRNSENLVNFNVCRVLAGDRSDFYSAGVKERMSIDFMVNCSLGMVDEVSELVLEYGIDVSLVDGRGNSGVHYAAANDKLEIIQLLTNFGAKLDCVNDEHLSPLNLCLLRYLAVLYDVTSWEDAFLIDKKISPRILHQILDKETAFNPNSSLLNVLSHITINRDYKGTRVPKKKTSNTTLVHSQIDIVSMTDILAKLDVVRYSESSCKMESGATDLDSDQNYLLGTKLTKLNATAQKPKPVTTTSAQNTTTTSTSPEDHKMKELNNIYATLSVLLYYGAKPYICEVPVPSLHLAVYTENHNLIDLLLQNGSDTNVCLEEFNLTPLHIVSTLPASEENYLIFKLLLKYSANVLIKTNAAHWPEEMKLIISNYTGDVLETDKNSLHILALRYDYSLDTEQRLVKMATDLIEAGIDTKELYLGHTVLTLAMLRQNLSLFEFLLQYFDAQQELGCKMGTALTVLILKRYHNVFAKEQGIQLVDLLISSGVNPLKRIGEHGNAFDFINKEYAVEKKTGKNNIKNKDKGKETKSKEQTKNSTKQKKGTAKQSKVLSANEEIKNYILQIARAILIRKIQISIVKFLIQYYSTREAFNEFTSNLAHFLNYIEFVEIVQQLMYIREIISCPCLKPFLLEIGTYINNINPVPTPKGKDLPHKSLQELLDELDYEAPDLEVVGAILKLPEFEQDEEIFEVCFTCLQRLDKYLIRCPSCNVVLFCSEACNRADMKLKLPKRHHCQQLVYNTKKQNLFNDELGLENRFKQFQSLYIELSSHRTSCLMGEYQTQPTKSTCSKYSTCFTYDSKITEPSSKRSNNSKPRHLCKPPQSRESCSSKRSRQKQKSSTTMELSSCVYTDLHHSKRSSTKTKTSKQQQKLSLMENILKSISNSTYARDIEIRDDILKLASKKENVITVKSERTTSIGTAEKDTASQHAGMTTEVNKTSTSSVQEFRIIEIQKNVYDFTKHQKRYSHQIEGGRRHKLSLDSHKREAQSKRQKQLTNTHDLNEEAQNLKGKLNPVLPKGYNKFFVQFRKMFPEFDVTTLLLPYACYRNGQLYYRFLDKEPVFMETYSNL